MPSLRQTIRFTRRNLPHWEVQGGRYFITVRCADSLPVKAVGRLVEIAKSLASIEPNSEAFSQLQRRYFLTLEKHLDAGAGFCPMLNVGCAQAVVNELTALKEWNVQVLHFSIMPNHWHALLVLPQESSPSLSAILKRIKGRTGRQFNQLLGRSGSVWQREWFDHWIRDEPEWNKCVDYIRQNPVKAKLAPMWSEHPWTR